MNSDDEALIRAARSGEREAFAEMVERYQVYVYRIAFGVLQNPHAAEDVTQEAFLRVFQTIHRLRDARAFPTWLARVTTRCALDHAKHNRQPSSDVYLHESAQIESGPQDRAESWDQRLDLQRAMAQLSMEHRAALWLREFQGMDYQEIAAVLGVPVGTVRSRIHFGRQRLREILSEQGGGER